MPFPYSLHVPHTMSLLAHLGRDFDGRAKRGFISEFDCTVDVDYENTENWEISSITIEQSGWNNEFCVTAKSDPYLWKIVNRALDHDWKDLSARINEMIIEARVDRDGDRGDLLNDLRNEAA